MKISSLQRQFLLILVAARLSHGLMCFTCWKFVCNDDYDSCYEMRHLPAANNNTLERTDRWRTSPECPYDDHDLRWSKEFIQNCSAEEDICGSYFIKITASVSKNSINESEYPILVTPTYYHSSIVALGCAKAGTGSLVYETPAEDLTTERISPQNMTANVGTTFQNEIKSMDLSTATSVRITTIPTTTSTRIIPPTTILSKKTEPKLSQDALPALPKPQPYVDIIIPIIAESIGLTADMPMCNPLTHEENRASYGSLVRINISGEYLLCGSCRDNFCNSKVPNEKDVNRTTVGSNEGGSNLSSQENESISGSSMISLKNSNGFMIILIAAIVVSCHPNIH